MIRLPSPVVCVEDAPVPEFVVNRTEVADLLAALVRPPPPRRRKPYDVGPGPHSHRDRWRARVNRLNDLAALTFDERGVRLPCGDVRAWRELPQGQPQRPALHAALARLCRCPTPEEATESFLAADLFPSHFADDATRGFDVTGAFESTGSDFGLIAHDGFEVTLTRNPRLVFGESVALSLARRGLVRTSTMRYLEIVADLAPGAWRMLESVARHWPHPQHMRDWLAWASLGAAQIEQAEQLARVAAERLRPFGINPPAATEKDEDGTVHTRLVPWRVVWRVRAERPTILIDGRPSAHTRGWPVEASAYGHRHGLWGEQYQEGLRAGEDPFVAWCAAHVGSWPDDPAAPPCPHDPVLTLTRKGLFLDAILPHEGALVIAVPPLPQETVPR